MKSSERLVSSECAVVVANALSQSRLHVTDMKVSSEIHALLQIMELAAEGKSNVSVTSLLDRSRRLLIEVCQSSTPPQGISAFVQAYTECIQSLIALDISRAFVRSETKGPDRLMQSPVIYRVKPLHEGDSPIPMFWQSQKMQESWERSLRIAETDNNVLLQAERGTGKELFARSIHEHSQRRDKKLVVVNSTTIPESIAEGTLFGHMKGAFTGATSDKKGLLELASGGSLFIDEIGNMPIAVQELLLRIFEYGDYRKLGDQNGGGKADLRIIAATNRDLSLLTEQGKFLPDLLDRLQFSAHIPALRDRSDLEQLAAYLLERKHGGRTMSQSCMSKLHLYSWPGNVRELDNALLNATMENPKGRIEWDDIAPFLRYS